MTTLHIMLALVLCGIGAGSLVLYWFTTVSPKFSKPHTPFIVLGACCLLVGIAIIAISIFYKNWLHSGRRNLRLRILEIACVAGACLTFALAGQTRAAMLFGIMAVAILAAVIWELRKPAEAQVLIDEKGIRMPRSGIMRLLPWSDVEKVLVRHGILSIELQGNRRVQLQLKPGSQPDAAAIETYCTEKAAEGAVARSNDW